MKLLVCTAEYYPHGSGIANVAYNIVNEFKKQGVDCVVCSPTGPDIFLGDRELIQKFGVIGILYYWYKVHTYFAKNCEYNITWLHQPLFILRNPFLKSLSTIHVTTLGYFKTVRNLNFNFFLKMYYIIFLIIEFYSLKKIRYNTKFITDNPKVSQELIEIVGNRINPVCISNGVDIRRFKPIADKKIIRDRLGIPKNKKIFLTVGRLTLQKRLFLMVDIFAKILQNDDSCFLIIAGKGELRSKLIDYISFNNLKDTDLIDFVPDADLPELYACADYYIMTSEYEGQPLTLLEAMASGLPCIVSDIPNLGVVTDANCGIVVNYSNKDEAVKIIVDYIQKNNFEHANNARKYTEKNLDWSIIANKYLDKIQKL